jgi:hypothetical protein
VPYASFKLIASLLRWRYFSKMSSIEHSRAVDRCIVSIKTVRSAPETNIVRAFGGSPEDRMKGMQLPLRTEAHEIGKLSAAEVVGHEVRKAINGFRYASFDVY